MGIAFFYMVLCFALGGALLYFGIKLRLHKSWKFKALGVALIFTGVYAGFDGVKTFIKRYEDEKELQTLRAKVEVEARAQAPRVPVEPKLEVRVDFGTGCQYLVSPNNSLVPRMDSTGKQVCK